MDGDDTEQKQQLTRTVRRPGQLSHPKSTVHATPTLKQKGAGMVHDKGKVNNNSSGANSTISLLQKGTPQGTESCARREGHLRVYQRTNLEIKVLCN